jgi:IS5 family transposase
VLRCALLKQYRQLSYEELAFHLEDSASFRAFARLPWAWSPKKSVLKKTISAVRAATWEAINRMLLSSARQEKLQDGSVVRLDSNVTAALMHEPSDSSLLWDAVRTMTHLLKQADAFHRGIGRGWRNHCRAAKKRWRAIEFARNRPQRVPLYRELIQITRATLTSLRNAVAELAAASKSGRRALAGQGALFCAADRADHHPKRAAGVGRRSGAGQCIGKSRSRSAGLPVSMTRLRIRSRLPAARLSL